MLAIAALVSAVATLLVALAAVFLLVKLVQVADLLSDELKRSKVAGTHEAASGTSTREDLQE
jgi:uncharacterized protein YoxC